MDAVEKLERFRAELANTNIDVGERSINCTVSIGVCKDKRERLDTLLIYADHLLYKAKETGKNKVVFD